MNIGIVGMASHWKQAPFDDPDWELWGMNTAWTFQPVEKFTRWYEMHDIDVMYGPEGEQTIDRPDHIEWLYDSSRGVRLHMLPDQKGAEFRPWVAVDVDGLMARFGRYFTNTVSWMLADAIWMLDVDKIGLWGVDMETPHEQAWERPSIEYLIGWARGLGIQVEIAKESNLLTTPYVYGVDQLNDMRHVLRRRIDDYEDRARRYRETAAELRGAAEEARNTLSEWNLRMDNEDD